MNKITWKNEKRKVSKLKSFEGNPRQANEKQIKDLHKSLERFSLAAPLVINTDGTVIGGNFRLSREKERGTKEVDVRVPSRALTRKESEELNLRLNKNLGSWDNEVLTNFSEDLLLDVGWDKNELDEIFGIGPFGNHRLAIGNSTDKGVWRRLLGEERFDFMFTDPPYKLAYSKTRTKKIKTKTGESAMKKKKSQRRNLTKMTQ